MKELIKDYYRVIFEKSENEIQKLDINLSETKRLFSQNTKGFDLFNFYLITKTILSKEENNFQILIPDKYFKDDFLSPVLLATSILKYKQNIEYYQKQDYNHKEINIGDVFYLSHKKRFCKCIQKNGDNYGFDFVNTNKKEENAKTLITIKKEQLSRLHKLRNIENFDYNGQSKKHLEKYLEFYQKVIGKYETLVTFKKKTVIIAEYSITQSLTENKDLPFRYNLERNDNVPVKPMIEIFNSYEQAREYLKENENTDELIVVGYKKYQNCIGDLQNDQNKGRFKKLILIGSKKIDDENFKFWQWTNKEIINLTKKQITGKFITKSIPSNNLTTFQNELNNYQKELIEIGIKNDEAKSIINYFINLFSRQLIIDKDNILQYINSIFEDPENDLYVAINEAGKPKEKEYFTKKLATVINNFLENFISQKLNFLCKQKQTDKNYYVVSEKRQFESLNDYCINNKLNITPITSRNVEKIISNCDTNIQTGKDANFIFFNPLNNEIKFRFSKKQIKRNVFIIPYVFFKYENPLWYYHLYNKITEFGDVYFLNYENIEDDRTKMFETLYKKQDTYRLKHKDRFWFTNIEFPETEILDKETEEILSSFDTVNSEQNEEKNEKRINRQKKIKQYFTDNFKIKSDFNRKSSEKDITDIDENNTQNNADPISKEKYKIILPNNETLEVGEHEKFAVKIRKDYNLFFVKNLTAKNEIIKDWNLNLREILKILSSYTNFIAEIKTINEAANLWQTWLNGLFENYKRNRSETDALKKLYGRLKLSVSIQTMENWLNNKEANFFPRSNNDLQAIIDLKLFLTPENNETNIAKKEEYKQHAENIKKGSTSLLYEIKRELTIYICKKEKGKVLSVLNQNHLNQLLRKKQTATIQNIQKL